VSAEAFGKYHVKAAFKPKEVAKSQEIKDSIKDRLAGSFMFMSLDQKDL
jgi:hypothetical protein